MTPEQKIDQPNTKTVKTMDKQLLEQEAKMWVSENWKPTRVAAYIAGATSSSTVKELEREVERLKGLVKSQFFKYYDDSFQESVWEIYKTENNL